MASSPLPIAVLCSLATLAPGQAGSDQAPASAPAPPFAILSTAGSYPRWKFLMPTDPDAAGLIERGLAWLRRQQQADGYWGAHPDAHQRGVHDVALTGLALLAFAREGKPPANSPDRAAIERAATWLANQQAPAQQPVGPGNVRAGRLGMDASPDWIYGHAIGTTALAAAVLTVDSPAAGRALQPALDYLTWHRNPFGVWRYQPRDGDNDTSVSTWCTLALAAGVQAGAKSDEAARKGMSLWLDVVTGDNGRTGYTKKGERSSRSIENVAAFPTDRGETLTAAGLLCRQALGQGEADVRTWNASRDLLLKRPPTWNPDKGDVDYCGWFFGTEAMRRLDAKSQQAWRDALVAAATKGQCKNGDDAGSWDQVDPWSNLGGRTYATAMMVLALQGLYPLADPAAPVRR